MREASQKEYLVKYFHASHPNTEKRFLTYEEAETFFHQILEDSWCWGAYIEERRILMSRYKKTDPLRR